ncbi:fibroblast growth factor 14 isoform X2 [Tachysurus ichikawai]
MAAAIASGLIRQKRQAREQHLDRPSTNRRRKSPNKNKGLCNGNLVDIFAKVRIFGLRKRRLRRQGLGRVQALQQQVFQLVAVKMLSESTVGSI